MAVAAMKEAINEEERIERLIAASDLKELSAVEFLRRRQVMLKLAKDILNKAKNLDFDTVLIAYENGLISELLYGDTKCDKEIWNVSYEAKYLIKDTEKGIKLLEEAVNIDDVISAVKLITRDVPF